MRHNSNSLTHTVPSSFVCTSPLAVITVTGLLETRTVSNSDERKSSGSTCALMLRNLQQILAPLDSSRMVMAYTKLQNVALSLSLASSHC